MQGHLVYPGSMHSGCGRCRPATLLPACHMELLLLLLPLCCDDAGDTCFLRMNTRSCGLTSERLLCLCPSMAYQCVCPCMARVWACATLAGALCLHMLQLPSECSMARQFQLLRSGCRALFLASTPFDGSRPSHARLDCLPWNAFLPLDGHTRACWCATAHDVLVW